MVSQVVQEVNKSDAIITREGEPLGEITVKEDYYRSSKYLGSFVMKGLMKKDSATNTTWINPDNVGDKYIIKADKSVIKWDVIDNTGTKYLFKYEGNMDPMGHSNYVYIFEDANWVKIRDSKVSINLVGVVDNTIDTLSNAKYEEQLNKEAQYKKEKEEVNINNNSNSNSSDNNQVLNVMTDTIRLAPLLPFANDVVTGFNDSQYVLSSYTNITNGNMSGFTEKLPLFGTITIQCEYHGKYPMKSGDYAILWPTNQEVGFVKVFMSNSNNNVTEVFVLQGAALRKLIEGKEKEQVNNVVYFKGIRFNKMIYPESLLLVGNPEYKQKLNRLMGDSSDKSTAYKKFFNAPVTSLVSPALLEGPRSSGDGLIGLPVDPNNNEGPSINSRPGYSNNLLEYIKTLKPLESNSVIAQESFIFGRPDITPPDTTILHKAPEKTFIQRYGLVTIGAITAGFAYAYYGKNRNDFIESDYERENIKSREDVRQITKESLAAERGALHAYQQGGLGSEVAQSTRAATNDAIHILENEMNMGIHDTHTELMKTENGNNVIKEVSGPPSITKEVSGDNNVTKEVSGGYNPLNLIRKSHVDGTTTYENTGRDGRSRGIYSTIANEDSLGNKIYHVGTSAVANAIGAHITKELSPAYTETAKMIADRESLEAMKNREYTLREKELDAKSDSERNALAFKREELAAKQAELAAKINDEVDKRNDSALIRAEESREKNDLRRRDLELKEAKFAAANPYTLPTVDELLDTKTMDTYVPPTMPENEEYSIPDRPLDNEKEELTPPTRNIKEWLHEKNNEDTPPVVQDTPPVVQDTPPVIQDTSPANIWYKGSHYRPENLPKSYYKSREYYKTLE